MAEATKGLSKSLQHADKLLAAKATPKAVVHHVLKTDTASIRLRSLNNAALKRLLDNPDFDYHREKHISSLSLWERFWRWFWSMLQQIGPKESPTHSYTWLAYLFLAAVLCLIVFIIIKFVLRGSINVFGRNAKEIDLDHELLTDNIHEISFDEEIDTAIAANNYRLAVRLLYLRTLKQLNDAGLIHWKMEKTNSAYLNELTDGNQRRLFGMVTRQFEYVWYGNFPVDGASYQNISSLFNHFKQQMP